MSWALQQHLYDLFPDLKKRHEKSKKINTIRSEIQKVHPKVLDLFDELIRILPGANSLSQKVTQEDTEALEDWFWEKSERVISDRDAHRAHKYELKNKKKKQQVDRMELIEVLKVFEEIEEMFNKIRVLVDQSSFAYSDMNFVSVKGAAEDIVDQVLMGTSKRICLVTGFSKMLESIGKNPNIEPVYYYQFRDKFYQEAVKRETDRDGMIQGAEQE